MFVQTVEESKRCNFLNAHAAMQIWMGSINTFLRKEQN